MQRILSKRFYLVNLVVISVAGVLMGLSVVRLIELQLMGGAEGTGRRRLVTVPSAASHASLPPARPDDVRSRNIFCSGCDRRPPPPGPDPARPPETLEGAVLLATSVAHQDLGWSLATTRFARTGRTRLLGPGSRVGDAVITRVAAYRVEFRRQGRVGVLELIPGRHPIPAPRAAGKASPGQRFPGIRRLGPRRFAIDRQTLQALIRGFASLGPDGHGVPITKGGRLAGFRLQRVRPGGVFARLGLRVSDAVVAVNNRRLDSPDVLVGLLAQLPGARHVTVGLVRNGRPVSLDYSIE